jgi:hypothetical protein
MARSGDKAPRKRRCMTEQEKVKARRRREDKKKDNKRLGKSISTDLVKGKP